jgi:Tfp pilus assembly protein PilX
MSRLRRDDGFSMIVVMVALIIGTLLSIWALDAATGDLAGARGSQDRKAAYAAAESGIDYYRYRLAKDNNVWKDCENVDSPPTTPRAPVNQAWDGTGADPRQWRNVTGSSAQYTVELLPANGATACSTTAADATMIDTSTGTFRIRATGRVGKVTRSIVATFRRKSFLDFLYFTDYETMDPIATSDPIWSQANCVEYRPQRPGGCVQIQFGSFDALNGPVHSNDSWLICGGATFGRNAGDRLESSQASPGWVSAGCSGSPNFKAPFNYGVASMDMPPTNASLSSAAVAPYRYTGRTSITFRGTVMDVTLSDGTTLPPQPLPPNGILWVGDGGCTVPDQPPPNATYTESSGCATVYVHGTYSQDITIASAKDIVVDGDFTRNGDYVAGLIANNFVRVQHKVIQLAGLCTNAPGSGGDRTIDAAIMSVGHSFFADNYDCGAPLGTLHVNGAIAQRFRGTVATSGGSSVSTGYAKDYNYDNRLHYRNPPYFLDPVESAWLRIRQNEQVPATGT